MTTVTEERLPLLIARAAFALTNATTAAEVLDIQKEAALFYDLATVAARFAEAKDAYGTVLAACRKMQAELT